MAKILLVEDDPQVCETVQQWLTFEHHRVEVLNDGATALEHLDFYKFDLIILDIGLPKVTGVELCRSFRSKGGRTAILMLTGRSSPEDIELGLDSGADDYLPKPFHPRELSARVRVLLRRVPSDQPSGTIEGGGLVLHLNSFKVEHQGQDIHLAPAEFMILQFLMERRDRVVTTAELVAYLQTADDAASANSLRTRIKVLRKKLDKPDSPSLIKNVHGVGYQFAGL